MTEYTEESRTKTYSLDKVVLASIIKCEVIFQTSGAVDVFAKIKQKLLNGPMLFEVQEDGTYKLIERASFSTMMEVKKGMVFPSITDVSMEVDISLEKLTNPDYQEYNFLALSGITPLEVREPVDERMSYSIGYLQSFKGQQLSRLYAVENIYVGDMVKTTFDLDGELDLMETVEESVIFQKRGGKLRRFFGINSSWINETLHRNKEFFISEGTVHAEKISSPLESLPYLYVVTNLRPLSDFVAHQRVSIHEIKRKVRERNFKHERRNWNISG